MTLATDNCGAVTTTYASTGATAFINNQNGIAVMNLGTSTVMATARDLNFLTRSCPTTVTVRAGMITTAK